jgi:hypothetical protein
MNELNRQETRKYFLLEGKVKDESRLDYLLDCLSYCNKRITYISIAMCSRDLSKSEEIELDIINELVLYMSTELGIPVEVGGDPRGYLIKFTLPSGTSNSFGGGVWGIY